MNKLLEEWERIYNQVRPRLLLDNLTPREYIQPNYPQCWPQPSQYIEKTIHVSESSDKYHLI